MFLKALKRECALFICVSFWNYSMAYNNGRLKTGHSVNQWIARTKAVNEWIAIAIKDVRVDAVSKSVELAR